MPAKTSKMRESRSQGLALFAVIVLTIASVLAFSRSTFNIDTVRDWAFALDIATGQRWHNSGPMIGYLFHLGPLWFYLLAGALALGVSVPGLVWLTAIIGASSIPLAWGFGRAVGNWRLGLLFAVTVATPGWLSMLWIASTHTILTLPSLFAALWAAAIYQQKPSARQALVFGLAFMFAVHGHPTALLLCLVFGGLLIWQFNRRSLAHIALAVLPLILSLAPYVIDQMQSGWPDATPVITAVVAKQATTDWLGRLPAVFASSLLHNHRTGLIIAAPTISETARTLYSIWIGLLWGVGAAALVWSFRQFSHRYLALALLVTALTGIVLITAIRPMVSYYMVELPNQIWPLLATLGWWRLTQQPSARLGKLSVVVLSLHCCLILALNISWLMASKRGEYAVPVTQAINFSHLDQAAPLKISGSLTIAGLARLIPWLCHDPVAAFHGDAVIFLDQAAATLQRAACPQLPPPVLGGLPEHKGAREVAGISCRLLDYLAPTVTVTPLKVIQGLCFVPAQAHGVGRGLTPSDTRIYPPRTPIAAGVGEVVIEGQLAPNQALLLTPILPFWAPYATPIMHSADLKQVDFKAGFSTAWVSSKPNKSVYFRLVIPKADVNHVDVFSITSTHQY
jgi:hypothetical protein